MSSRAAVAAAAPVAPAGRPGQAAGHPGAGAGPPEIDAARLRVAILRLSRLLRKHDLAGLTPTQLSALATAEHTGPIRLGDLATAERIAPSTLTRLVSVLEDCGYVQRESVPGDARAASITVTAGGHEVLAQIRTETTALLAGELRQLADGHLGALEAALPALEQLAENWQVTESKPASG